MEQSWKDEQGGIPLCGEKRGETACLSKGEAKINDRIKQLLLQDRARCHIHADEGRPHEKWPVKAGMI